jgi:hypothetical protein
MAALVATIHVFGEVLGAEQHEARQRDGECQTDEANAGLGIGSVTSAAMTPENNAK